MPESDTEKDAIDLGDFKTIIDQNSNQVFQDLSSNDLDWFLRDPAMDDKAVSRHALNSKKTLIDDNGSATSTKDKTPNYTNNNTTSNADNYSNNHSNNNASNYSNNNNAVNSTSNGTYGSNGPYLLPTRTASLPKITPASPHLTTTILNTNDNYSTKTKPSVAPIQEETAVGQQHKFQGDSSSSSRSRSNSVSAEAPRRKSSIFRKLKSKFIKEESPQLSVNSSSASLDVEHYSAGTGKETETTAGIFKENYGMSGLTRTSTNIDRKSTSANRPHMSSFSSFTPQNEDHAYKLQRTMSTPMYANNSKVDPRLEEYIRFYSKDDKEIGSRIRRGLMVGVPVEQPTPVAQTSPVVKPPSSMFHRFKSVSAASGGANEKYRALSDASSNGSDEINLKNGSNNKSNSNENLPPILAKLKPLKRVAFHSSTFNIDPPQQIPLRHPRKGNVEVLPNGSLQIHPMNEEDKLAQEKSQMGHGGGIVIGGLASASNKKALEEETEDPDTKVDRHAQTLGIEKPMLIHKHNYLAPIKKMQLDLMYTRCCHLREILPIPTILKQIPPGLLLAIPILQLRNPTPTMVEVQTFADFVRIAPIVCVSLDGISLSLDQFRILLLSMVAKKQLEKLSLRNTSIDQDGWLLLCWFLSRNKVLNRLDITQCPSLQVNVLKKKKKKPLLSSNNEEEIVRMNGNKDNRLDMDWELFTASLAARGGIDELILTGCCIQDNNEFEQLIKLGALIRTSKLGLAYSNLLTKQVRILYDHWVFKPFARGIDLGYNDFLLTAFFSVFLEQPNKDFLKMNLGFISLNSTNIRFLDLFKEFAIKILIKLPNLKYLDLSNNSALFGLPPFIDDTKVEAGDDEKTLTPITRPRADSKLQQNFISFFTLILPLFTKLIRLHIENNNLSSESIIQIARILPLCKNLGYFSVQGNNINLSAAALLLQAVEYLKTLMMIDCEYDNLSPLIKKKMGMYLVRNMERTLTAQWAKDQKRIANSNKDSKFDSSIHADVAEEDFENHTSLSEQLSEIIDKKSKDKLQLDDPQIQLVISKTKRIRKYLLTVMDELYQLQLRNELNVEGKEALIRFVFVEASIQRGLLLIDPSLVEDDGTSETLSSIRFRSSAESHSKTDSISDVSSATSNTVHPKIPLSQLTLVRDLSLRTNLVNLASLDRQEGTAFKFGNLRETFLAQEAAKGKGEESRKILDHIDAQVLSEDIIKELTFHNLEDPDVFLKNLEEITCNKGDFLNLYTGKEGDKILEGVSKLDEEQYRDSLSRLREEWKHILNGGKAKKGTKSAEGKDTSENKEKDENSNGSESPNDGKEVENGTLFKLEKGDNEETDPQEMKRRMSTTYDAILNEFEGMGIESKEQSKPKNN